MPPPQGQESKELTKEAAHAIVNQDITKMFESILAGYGVSGEQATFTKKIQRMLDACLKMSRQVGLMQNYHLFSDAMSLAQSEEAEAESSGSSTNNTDENAGVAGLARDLNNDASAYLNAQGLVEDVRTHFLTNQVPYQLTSLRLSW